MGGEPVSTISTYFRVCDGVRVRFADNKADSRTTVLLLAPWPESLWAFRRIWNRVAAVGRVVAIDLPGFGHSDGRPDLIAPDSSGAFLASMIDEWGLGAPHVVGPDVGTAAAPSASEPEVHEDYVSAYDLGRFAESARFVRHYPEQNPVLRDLLPSITTPTQIVAGRHDDLVPWSNNQYLDHLLPNSEIHPLDAGHFAWEEVAEDYGRLVADWVTGGYRRVVAG
jgi:pimeloyl-ACP methyl ester carboxylesterase